MAADSNKVNGLPPGPSESTIAGMRWLGVIFRNSGLNWSPAPISTGITLYSRPSSSSAICTFWPFGVGQLHTSNIGYPWVALCGHNDVIASAAKQSRRGLRRVGSELLRRCAPRNDDLWL